MERYPTVRFIVGHGRWLSVAVGLCPLLVVLVGVLLEVWGAVWWLAAVALGGVLWLAFRAFAELTGIIAEMLLPE